MKGGLGVINNLYKIQDKEQLGIKVKNTDLFNNINIKTNTSSNENKTLNTKNQSANYLIEYFEGIMLNYISLDEEKGKRMDELKNLILSHKKKDKFKGGNNSYLDNDPEYKNYTDDRKNTSVNIPKFDNANWDTTSIEVHIDYQNEYYIHIKHRYYIVDDDESERNKIDLIIDLQHNAIIDKANRLCNDDICANTKNITYILETIIAKLIEYSYDDYYSLLSLSIHDKTKTDPINNKTLDLQPHYIKGIISLLIMILTLKSNFSKDVYKKYNTTFLLSGICKRLIRQLISNSYSENLFEINYNNSLFTFAGNNTNILTYSNKDYMINYGGDCALNSLMCVKNEDIRKLFIDKISYGQKNKTLDYTNDRNYYIREIYNVLVQMNAYQLEGFNYINSIIECINEYNEFITNLEVNYSLLKQGLENYNYSELDQSYKDYFNKIYKQYFKFSDVLRNNLFDYDLSSIEAKEMCEDITKDLNKANDLIQKGGYGYTLGARVFITIIDKYMKYKDSFCIFYINLLIALLLIQYKIDYLFDEDIINVLRHSDDKTKIIKCFQNVEHNRNELDDIFPMYQQGYGNDKYIFKYAILHKIPHAVFYIIDVSTPIKKMYLYDLNRLYMVCSEDFDKNNTNEATVSWHNRYEKIYPCQQEYKLINDQPRWIRNQLYEDFESQYYNDIKTYFENIIRLTDYSFWYGDNNEPFEKAVIKSLNLNNITVFDENGYLDIVKLFTLNNNDYNENNFNYIYNIKIQIFNKLINYINTIDKTNADINFLNTINYITDYVQKNIIDNKSCDIKKLLFKFIECLIKAKLVYCRKTYSLINLDNEYKIIKKYFDDTYHLTNTRAFVNYLGFKDKIGYNHYKYNSYITKILNKLTFDCGNLAIVHGGNSDTNSNNTIFKRILIILLIIVIIIIVVLIVLYIINKYKNKNIQTP